MSDSLKHGFKLPPEQQAIRDKCFHPSGAFVEFPIEDVETSIPARFEKIVRQYPHRLAVKEGNQTFTYAELNDAVNRVAWGIADRLGNENQALALLLEHNAMAIVGALALLKAGKMLVAIDPAFPAERIRYILEDSQSVGILTNSKYLRLANVFERTANHALNIDQLNSIKTSERTPLSLSGSNLTQIVYTSGSSGRPKGILRDHRILLQEVSVRVAALGVHPGDLCLLLHTPTANAFLIEILTVLLSGATLIPFDVKREGTARIAERLISERVTIYRSLSSTYRSVLKSLTENETFPHLRLICVGGEPIFKGDLELYKKYFSEKCVLVHQLGGGETGQVCMYFIDSINNIDEHRVPVGWPVTGKEVLIVNDFGEPLPVGEVGEIGVKSRYLSLGYWRNPGLTAQKYFTDPNGQGERIYLSGDLGRLLPNGCLVHLGRKDSLVKIRGYGISLTEVEGAILEHPSVKETAAVAWENEPGEKYLAAYIIPLNASPTVTELRQFLKKRLPYYMMPSAFMFLESLPLTNGKLDRRALPKPDGKRPELSQPYVSPRSEIDQKLVQIWKEVLDIRPIGIHDNFFDLGGHSLAASRVIFRVIQEFNLELPVRALFDAPTVAEMAAVIAQNQAKRASDEQLAQMLCEVEAMTDAEAQKQLARESARSSKGDGDE